MEKSAMWSVGVLSALALLGIWLNICIWQYDTIASAEIIPTSRLVSPEENWIGFTTAFAFFVAILGPLGLVELYNAVDAPLSWITVANLSVVLLNFFSLIFSSQATTYYYVAVIPVSIISLVIPAILTTVLHEEKRKATRIDPLIVKVAEKYRRPISASVLTRELELSLEDSRKAFNRFVKNKQGKVIKDADGNEYMAIPSVWSDLPRVENTVLKKLLKLGARSKRAELRAWLGLPEIAFSQVMNSLEKNGYVVYDRMSDEYGLTCVS